MERFFPAWIEVFPDYPLSPGDLKNSQTLIEALLKLFERLGMNLAVILAPPSEEHHSEHSVYYWDLIPVINITRVFNYLVSGQLNFDVRIMDFLQPKNVTSSSILILVFNLMLFVEDQCNKIRPHEEQLFAQMEQVASLETKKNNLVQKLNLQAEEKGKRAVRLEELDHEEKKLKEGFQQDKEVHSEKGQELEASLKSNQQLNMLADQKKAHIDAVISEIARKRALRVYDADDAIAKWEQVSQNVQEAEEKLNSLKNTLLQAENRIKNMQSLSLDIVKNHLNDFARSGDYLKEIELGDFELCVESERNMLITDRSDLQPQLAELLAARQETAAINQESQAKRLMDKATTQSVYRNAEEKDKKCIERVKNAQALIEASKQQTVKYEEKKSAGMTEIATIEKNFYAEQKEMEDYLIKKALEVEKRVSELMRNM